MCRAGRLLLKRLRPPCPRPRGKLPLQCSTRCATGSSNNAQSPPPCRVAITLGKAPMPTTKGHHTFWATTLPPTTPLAQGPNLVAQALLRSPRAPLILPLQGWQQRFIICTPRGQSLRSVTRSAPSVEDRRQHPPSMRPLRQLPGPYGIRTHPLRWVAISSPPAFQHKWFLLDVTEWTRRYPRTLTSNTPHPMVNTT